MSARDGWCPPNHGVSHMVTLKPGFRVTAVDRGTFVECAIFVPGGLYPAASGEFRSTKPASGASGPQRPSIASKAVPHDRRPPLRAAPHGRLCAGVLLRRAGLLAGAGGSVVSRRVDVLQVIYGTQCVLAIDLPNADLTTNWASLAI
ncbi:hypothetical protein SNK04_013978 [Fusarium graminearum]